MDYGHYSDRVASGRSVTCSAEPHAFGQRFVRFLTKVLRRIILIGQASLRRAIAEYVGHFHEERNQQGLDNRLIRAIPAYY